MKTYAHTKICLWMLKAAFFTIVKNGNNPMVVSWWEDTQTVVHQLCLYTRYHWMVHMKWVICMIRRLYLNRTIKMSWQHLPPLSLALHLSVPPDSLGREALLTQGHHRARHPVLATICSHRCESPPARVIEELPSSAPGNPQDLVIQSNGEDLKPPSLRGAWYIEKHNWNKY